MPLEFSQFSHNLVGTFFWSAFEVFLGFLGGIYCVWNRLEWVEGDKMCA
jgi:hypothetical protein